MGLKFLKNDIKKKHSTALCLCVSVLVTLNNPDNLQNILWNYFAKEMVSMETVDSSKETLRVNEKTQCFLVFLGGVNQSSLTSEDATRMCHYTQSPDREL